ncbi:MAG TPA: FtsX-like permease family protein [Rhodanobacteraceae bacterium]|nr:FtsX-like permease family protein [Rhodanobacteraceae bacterium]
MSSLAAITRALVRFHKILAGIIVLEYALTFAIIMVSVNVLFMRMEAANQGSGIDGRHVWVVQGHGADGVVHRYQMRFAKKWFESLSGVGAVSITSSVPFLGANSVSVPIGLPLSAAAGWMEPMQVEAYQVDAAFTRTLGVRIVRGRNFLATELGHRVGDMGNAIMLSQPLAERLFHGAAAVGQQVMLSDRMVTVVGVVAPLAAPNYLGAQRTNFTVLLPTTAIGRSVLAFTFTGPEETVFDSLEALNEHDADEVSWGLRPYGEIRADYFKPDRQAVLALAAVVVIVMLVALCGLIGLTNYWVAQRRAQIAIRRALGAKKAHIVSHFLLESTLLVVAGLVIGWCAEVVLARYFGLLPLGGDPRIWSLSLLLIAAMAAVTVFVSLWRWLRLDPANLLRAA